MNFEEYQAEKLARRERELRQRREEICWLLMTLHLWTGKPILKLAQRGPAFATLRPGKRE